MPVKPCSLDHVSRKDLDKAITPERVGLFWSYAKSIGANQGRMHEEVVSDMAKQFNLREWQVAHILDKNKTVRKMSEEVKTRQKATARFLADNRRFLADMDQTMLEKSWDLLNEGTRATLLSGHGPVIGALHPIDLLFTNPVTFLKGWIKTVTSLNTKTLDKMYDRMERDPLHKMFLDAGAPIGRYSPTEGFGHIGIAGKLKAKLGLDERSWAQKAMEPLKFIQFRWMKGEWEKLPKELQTPEMAKLLSEQGSHAVSKLMRGEKMEVNTRGFRKILLAGQMTPAKWQKVVFDPIKTVKTFWRSAESKVNKNIRPPTAAERRQAWIRTRNAAKYVGVIYSSMRLNQAILHAHNSKQQVNLDDPTRGDFLAYKVGGYYIRPRGSQEIIAFLSKLVALSAQPKKFGKQTPEEALGRYAEYKLTPIYGDISGLISGGNFFGRPAPWSKQEGTAKSPKLEVPEYVAEHGPIFIGHGVSAFYDELRQQGVDVHSFHNVVKQIARNPKAVKAAMLEGGLEFFGINVQKDRYMDTKPLKESQSKIWKKVVGY